MANRRPIRRAPTPRWKRGSRRPTRWIDAASSRSLAGNPCISSVKDCDCDPDLSPLVLLHGDTDWDWADRSEVRIDRLVGDLSWWSEVRSFDVTLGDPVPVLFRMGILATEETDTTFPVIDLFDPENLEEFQWMWLYGSTGTHDYIQTSDLNTIYLRQYDNIHLDLRVRRSLGKKDSVLLYSQMKFASSVIESVNFRTPSLSHDLRAVIRS